MKTIGILSTLASLIAVSSACPAKSPSTQAAAPIERMTVEQLINRLTEISNDEFSVRTNIFAVGGGNKLPQGLLMLQDAQPAPAEAMTELVRRGVIALPQLLEHLDDARKTKATIHITMYAAEFDHDPRRTKVRPEILARLGGNLEPGSARINVPPGYGPYAVAVGDICFNIIGQIVNRRYEAVRYQPSMVVIANSPVLCPDLRDAVRAEWTGLTPAQHRESLVADVVKPDRYERARDGVVALWRYYPEATAAAVKQRLDAPLYDSGVVWRFAEMQLYQALDGKERQRLIEQFVAQHGPAYKDGLLLRLWEDRYKKEGDSGQFSDSPKIQVAPARILDELMPKRDAAAPPPVDASDYFGISEFVGALARAGIHSPGIDQAVWGAFKTHCTSHSAKWDSDDRIAESCVKQLAHHGHDAELLAYCRRRYEELQRPYPKKYGQDAHENVTALLNLFTGA